MRRYPRPREFLFLHNQRSKLTLSTKSYLIGLWFSLRTHASQIWQNAQSSHDQPAPRPLTTHLPADRSSLYKRVLPGQLLVGKPNRDSLVGASPSIGPRAGKDSAVPDIELPQGLTAEELARAYEVVSAPPC